jgi:hypothetical protein
MMTLGVAVGSYDVSIMGIYDLSTVKTTGWWSDVCGISDLTWVLVGNTVSEMPRSGELRNSQ